MKLYRIVIVDILFVLTITAFGFQQTIILPEENLSAQGKRLPCFSNSYYFDEQVLTFKFNPDVRIQINAPSISLFDQKKPTEIIFFALPNGNTIEQTVGKILKTGDDWHFDIQHIGAQTRFIRQHDTSCNVVTVYLETSQL